MRKKGDLVKKWGYLSTDFKSGCSVSAKAAHNVQFLFVTPVLGNSKGYTVWFMFRFIYMSSPLFCSEEARKEIKTCVWMNWVVFGILNGLRWFFLEEYKWAYPPPLPLTSYSPLLTGDPLTFWKDQNAINEIISSPTRLFFIRGLRKYDT